MDFKALQAGMRKVLGASAHEAHVVSEARYSHDVLSQLEANVVHVERGPSVGVCWANYRVYGKSGTEAGQAFLPDSEVKRLSA